MSRGATDWAHAIERLQVGDRLALYELTRFITGFLIRWNAFDFRDDWDDLIQEVLIATVRALQEGRIRDRTAVGGYLKSTARFQFVDRLKSKLRLPPDTTLAWEERLEVEAAPVTEPGLSRDLEMALGQLDAGKRAAVLAVYVEGKTYDEAAEELGKPLGTLKRDLRIGLGQLKHALEPK